MMDTCSDPPLVSPTLLSPSLDFVRNDPFSVDSPLSSQSSAPPSRDFILTEDDFTFDTGNVNLTVWNPRSKKKMIGTVCSEVMVHASPVWKKFLFPPWEQTLLEAPKKIDCSDDDAQALLVLLNIAHLKFDIVPKLLPYQLLYHVAILVDQYQCLKLVSPWLKLWSQDEESQLMVDGQEGWLFIAWAFGRESIFEQLARKLLKRSTNYFGSHLRRAKRGGFVKKFSELMSPGILENILTIRNATITKLLNIPYTVLDRYSNSHDIYLCQELFEKKAFDSIIYGSLLLGLQSRGFWPPKTAKEIDTNFESFVSSLSSLKIEHLPFYPNNVLTVDHSGCCVQDFKSQILSVLEGMSDPVLDSHRVHIKIQRNEAERIGDFIAANSD